MLRTNQTLQPLQVMMLHFLYLNEHSSLWGVDICLFPIRPVFLMPFAHVAPFSHPQAVKAVSVKQPLTPMQYHDCWRILIPCMHPPVHARARTTFRRQTAPRTSPTSMSAQTLRFTTRLLKAQSRPGLDLSCVRTFCVVESSCGSGHVVLKLPKSKPPYGLRVYVSL